jgi:hypothetical protein
MTDAHKLPGHLFMHLNEVVQRVGDLAQMPVQSSGRRTGKIVLPEVVSTCRNGVVSRDSSVGRRVGMALSLVLDVSRRTLVAGVVPRYPNA